MPNGFAQDITEDRIAQLMALGLPLAQALQIASQGSRFSTPDFGLGVAIPQQFPQQGPALPLPQEGQSQEGGSPSRLGQLFQNPNFLQGIGTLLTTVLGGQYGGYAGQGFAKSFEGIQKLRREQEEKERVRAEKKATEAKAAKTKVAEQLSVAIKDINTTALKGIPGAVESRIASAREQGRKISAAAERHALDLQSKAVEQSKQPSVSEKHARFTNAAAGRIGTAIRKDPTTTLEQIQLPETITKELSQGELLNIYSQELMKLRTQQKGVRITPAQTLRETTAALEEVGIVPTQADKREILDLSRNPEGVKQFSLIKDPASGKTATVMLTQDGQIATKELGIQLTPQSPDQMQGFNQVIGVIKEIYRKSDLDEMDASEFMNEFAKAALWISKGSVPPIDPATQRIVTPSGLQGPSPLPAAGQSPPATSLVGAPTGDRTEEINGKLRAKGLDPNQVSERIKLNDVFYRKQLSPDGSFRWVRE
ncbi:hypothetical protein MYX75_02840 [Acidobacteria bacterium AH-259-A15]|nr:hypothetical protein [Acidobacteria bacterium AH-259-A15]